MAGKGDRLGWSESVVGSISEPTAPSSSLAGSASTWLRWEVPAAILAFATAVRLLGLDKSLWLDEASSCLQATAPDFVAAAREYAHPPLYTTLRSPAHRAACPERFPDASSLRGGMSRGGGGAILLLLR